MGFASFHFGLLSVSRGRLKHSTGENKNKIHIIWPLSYDFRINSVAHDQRKIIGFPSSFSSEICISEALTSVFSASIITDILDGKDAARWVQRSLPPFLEVY